MTPSAEQAKAKQQQNKAQASENTKIRFGVVFGERNGIQRTGV